MAATQPTLNVDSNDPFEVLGLEATPDLSKSDIKRAYKRLALKYHPDVITDQNTPPEEKKKASEVFAKINWAYEKLSGKGNQDSSSSSYPGTSSSTKSSSSSSSSSYNRQRQQDTPPHRRTSAYSSSGGYSTDWRDYMPKYDDEDYDTDGDSFGAIFSDLFAGAAGAVASGGVSGAGIFRDFVDFLENNVDGYGRGSSDDAQLSLLLQTGSVQEIGNEMDDTDLVVQQLSSKLSKVEDEILMCKADMAGSSRYLDKLDLEERIDELEARKTVVQGYIKKARARLLKLQTRYKELIVGGANDSRAGGRGSSDRSSPHSGSSYNDTPSSSSSYSSSSSSSSYGSTYSGEKSSTYSRSTNTGTAGSSSDKDEAWKSQSFGSSGRRGSSRRRRQQQEERSSTSSSYTSQDRNDNVSSSSSEQRRPSGSTKQDRTRSSASSTSSSGGAHKSSTSSSREESAYKDDVPPHRRTVGDSYRTKEVDKRRLRELKVDEEFEKLKKELGM